MPLSPESSSAGGEPFNGGTITEPLVIDAGTTADPLDVRLPADFFETVLNVTLAAAERFLLDVFDGGHTALELTDDDSNGFARLTTRGVVLRPASVPSFNGVLNVRGGGDQTDIAWWEKWDTGAGVGRIDKNGAYVTKVNAAPTDASMAANELALWFDSTAPALKVKAKDSGGTVRTASFPAQSTGTLATFGAAGGTQAAAIANPSGGAVADTEARAALSALLAAMRTYGLIAT